MNHGSIKQSSLNVLTESAEDILFAMLFPPLLALR